MKLERDADAYYWMKDETKSIAKKTPLGWYLWSRGKGWLFYPPLADIGIGKNTDWGMVTEDVAMARIQEMEDEFAAKNS